MFAGGPGYVAWGLAAEEGIPDVFEPASYPQLRWAGVPWTSADGRTWTRLADRGPFEWASVRSVVAAGGRLYAFGTVRDVDGETGTSSAWRSSDGLIWERLEEGPPFIGRGEVAFVGLEDGDILAFAAAGVGGPDAWPPEETWR